MKKLVAVVLVVAMLLSFGTLAIAEETVAAPVEQPIVVEAPVAAPVEQPAVVEAPVEQPAAVVTEAAPAEETVVTEVVAEVPAEVIETVEVAEVVTEVPAEEVTEEVAEVVETEEAAEVVETEEAAEVVETEEATEEAVTEDESMAVIEVPEDCEKEFTGSVSVAVFFAGDELYYGDAVTLRAVVRHANLDYSIRWEANNGEEWYKVGDGSSYGFIVNEYNAALEYRCVLVIAD